MRTGTGGRLLGVILAAMVMALVLARAAHVEEMKPVNPFSSNQAAPAKTQTDAKDSMVRLDHADVLKGAWGNRKTLLLKGNVKFTHEDTVLTSDQIDYDENMQTAVSPGKLSITNPECDITGDKGTAYFKKRLGVIEGSVVMQLKPKEENAPNPDSQRAKFTRPTTVTCPKLEYLYKAKMATASGGLVFKQDRRTLKAETAVYDQKKELLVLTGNVSGVDENGQTFEAPGKVTVSLKKGDEWIEAEKATASFKVDLGEEQEEAKE